MYSHNCFYFTFPEVSENNLFLNWGEGVEFLERKIHDFRAKCNTFIRPFSLWKDDSVKCRTFIGLEGLVGQLDNRYPVIAPITFFVDLES